MPSSSSVVCASDHWARTFSKSSFSFSFFSLSSLSSFTHICSVAIFSFSFSSFSCKETRHSRSMRVSASARAARSSQALTCVDSVCEVFFNISPKLLLSLVHLRMEKIQIFNTVQIKGRIYGREYTYSTRVD